MAIITQTSPIRTGEEASLRNNKRLLYWIKSRIHPVTRQTLSDGDFHREILKPRTLQIARVFVHKPNGLPDPKAHFPR